MKSLVHNFLNSLNKPESGLMLGLFRIAFGSIMFYHIFLHWRRLENYRSSLHLRLPYPELEWIPLLSYEGLVIVFSLGLISAFVFTLGYLYRYSALIMFLSYSYLFSLDALYYNNHYYLLALVSFLMLFCRADSRLVLFKPSSSVPYWNYLILQAQICIVFFYGGLSKVNEDWLGGYVLGSPTASFSNFMLGWGGMIFDLFIPFLLLFRKTRWFAIGLVIIFNLSNHFLFDDIALYPLLATASMLLFLEGTNKWEWLQNLFGNADKEVARFKLNKLLKISLLLYFIIQLTYPLRHLIMTGHPEWTGQGHYFSWRMKSYQKQVKLDFYAYDRTSQTRKYKINTGMNDFQIQRAGAMPHMILNLSDYMLKKIEKMDGKDENLGIVVDYKVSLNQLPEVLAIEPMTDLSQVSFNRWGKNPWITQKPMR